MVLVPVVHIRVAKDAGRHAHAYRASTCVCVCQPTLSLYFPQMRYPTLLGQLDLHCKLGDTRDHMAGEGSCSFMVVVWFAALDVLPTTVPRLGRVLAIMDRNDKAPPRSPLLRLGEFCDRPAVTGLHYRNTCHKDLAAIALPGYRLAQELQSVDSRSTVDRRSTATLAQHCQSLSTTVNPKSTGSTYVHCQPLSTTKSTGRQRSTGRSGRQGRQGRQSPRVDSKSTPVCNILHSQTRSHKHTCTWIWIWIQEPHTHNMYGSWHSTHSGGVKLFVCEDVQLHMWCWLGA